MSAMEDVRALVPRTPPEGFLTWAAAALEGELDSLLQKAKDAAEGNRSAAQEAERLRGQEALAVAASSDARAEVSALTAGIDQMEHRGEDYKEDKGEPERWHAREDLYDGP